MQLRYITCSDPREFNDIHDIVDLAKLSSRVEIAVQAHPSKMSHGMPRNEWFRELLDYVITDKININLAVHVNNEWCKHICSTGEIPTELSDIFDLCYDDDKNRPVVKRWQLNMSENAAKGIKYGKLKRLFNSNSNKEFIVGQNMNTRLAAGKLHDMGARFSLLYDTSGGRGLSPAIWTVPLYPNVAQGYAGGLSPENVCENLTRIARVAVLPNVRYDEKHKPVYSLQERRDIWIDAEGKLKTDDKFDIARAKKYILNAESWLKRQR